MIIEQIRYYISEENLDRAVQARREETGIREEMRLPAGRILVADPIPDEGPGLIWQCGYDDESDMAQSSSALIGNERYEAARALLGSLCSRVELELYMTIDEEQNS